jgi:transketolase
MSLGDIAKKFEAFGWDVCEVNGHDVEALHTVLSREKTTDMPRAVIACTRKGYGVSFMTDKAQWHGVAPDAQQARQAREELECARRRGSN